MYSIFDIPTAEDSGMFEFPGRKGYRAVSVLHYLRGQPTASGSLEVKPRDFLKGQFLRVDDLPSLSAWFIDWPGGFRQRYIETMLCANKLTGAVSHRFHIGDFPKLTQGMDVRGVVRSVRALKALEPTLCTVPVGRVLDLISFMEAADAAGVSTKVFDTLVRHGLVKVVCTRRSRRVSYSDLQVFLDKLRSTAKRVQSVDRTFVSLPRAIGEITYSTAHLVRQFFSLLGGEQFPVTTVMASSPSLADLYVSWPRLAAWLMDQKAKK